MARSAKLSMALSSKRKRADSVLPSAPASKHSVMLPLTRARDILHSAQLVSSRRGITSAFHASGSHRLSSQAPPLGQAGVHTLKSAFRPPPPPTLLWSRDVSVTEYQFTHSAAQYLPNGDVKITTNSEKLGVIAIAEDWVAGEELFEKKKPHYKSGFIGRGSSKRGIYVCPYRCIKKLLMKLTVKPFRPATTTKNMLLRSLLTNICPFLMSEQHCMLNSSFWHSVMA